MSPAAVGKSAGSRPAAVSVALAAPGSGNRPMAVAPLAKMEPAAKLSEISEVLSWAVPPGATRTNSTSITASHRPKAKSTSAARLASQVPSPLFHRL